MRDFAARVAFGVIAVACAASARGSLQTETVCNEGFCWSITAHRDEALRDHYSYSSAAAAGAGALRHVVIRFESGSLISLLISEGEGGACSNAVKIALTSAVIGQGIGCLGSSDGRRIVRIRYVLKAKNQSAVDLLHKVDPVIWLTAPPSGVGASLVESPLIPLDGR